MQCKIRILVIAFYTLSIALLWFVKLQACRSYCYTWYGMLPAQVGSYVPYHSSATLPPFLIRPCSSGRFEQQSTLTLCLKNVCCAAH